jgi:hypothetical protein
VFQGDISLTFTNKKGAALILPYEAQREDAVNDAPFKKHLRDNYRKWKKFAEECQFEERARLILVTGCDLTRQWATVTYSYKNREIVAQGGVVVAPAAKVNFSLSTGWSRNRAMETRQGPPNQPNSRFRLPWTRSRPPVNNQCVFLRGYHIQERKFLGFLGPKILKAGAGYHDPGKHGPDEEGTEGLLADEDITVEPLSPPTQVRTLTFKFQIFNFCDRMGAS